MPRIKIETPDKFIFSTEIPIRITDINYGGHLGNDSLLSIIQLTMADTLVTILYFQLFMKQE
ncbi:MAG: hypothetical protein MUE93_04775 [Ignavibacteriaceae bacterium]|nr:hypothetical protein [Ignavibacteriaceae bacterium]